MENLPAVRLSVKMDSAREKRMCTYHLDKRRNDIWDLNSHSEYLSPPWIVATMISSATMISRYKYEG